MSNSFAGSDALGDVTARIRLGADVEAPADLLYFLARDPNVTVRAAVAMNRNTPPPADAVLANDTDDRVRAILGQKIALIAVGLCEPTQSRLERVVRALLAALVTDEAERVRAMIAEVLKEMPNAPAEIIQRLAQDTAISVAEPIILFSPLLTEADLVRLLASPPCPGALGAVARRAHLSEAVCDAVVETANSDAIRDLLANKSAAIREATLDSLVAGASGNPAWHEPLVRRPRLSQASMQVLVAIVADNLVAALLARHDLAAELAADLRDRLADKIATRNLAEPPVPASALAQARALERSGNLTEAELINAIRAGDQPRVAAILAVSANVAPGVVERAVSLRSAKGLVSLTWRAGFSMRSAVAVQALLARLPPRLVVTATPSGGFPLTPDEMRWQLEFLEHAVQSTHG